ncbi:MAG TPA: TraB/GumN family protein [Candidatus Thermoplasmatota archaeon]|nr:TraB/GumN family protein [Candidatus Thermoplasmatota archaeon]
MITLIGTGHVFDLRRRLQREVLERTPDVVCLELDPGRLQALLARQRGARKADVPVAYRLLAEFQDRVASERGIAPGDEMLAAFEAAQLAKVPVELIDLDAQVAFKRLWSSMGLFEKARFLGSALVGMVVPKRFVDKELERIQEDYEGVFAQLARDYPTVKRVLIDERNAHMAARLAGLRGQGKERIVAVIGDGHVDGITALLGQQGYAAELQAVRLRDLQATQPQGPASVQFSTTVPWQPPPSQP